GKAQHLLAAAAVAARAAARHQPVDHVEHVRLDLGAERRSVPDGRAVVELRVESFDAAAAGRGVREIRAAPREPIFVDGIAAHERLLVVLQETGRELARALVLPGAAATLRD